jgi:D-inositol-3-phosphate glycosyltransferase
MRIAMVSEHASPLAALGGVDAGGQNVHVACLARELSRAGHEIVVHTRRDDAMLPPRVELVPGAWVQHVDAGPAEPISKDQLLPYMGDFARKLSQFWRIERPDIVHSHFWMSGRAALEAARPLGVPVVHTFHALGVVKRRYQGAKDTSPPERIRVEQEILDHADCVIATCSDEIFELVRLGGQIHRLKLVPCGVDIERFRPDGRSERRQTDAHRIVVLSRLVERKGVGNVISALSEVPQVELVVAGGPPRAELAANPEYRRLRQLAVESRVSDRVAFRGSIAHADVPPLLRSADVVACVPWYEPFGIVPLEAMACGVPVLATSVGGLVDTVVDYGTGVHVPPRSPEAIAEGLRALFEDAELTARLGHAGVARTRSRYSWPRVAAATLAIYQRILRRMPSSPHRAAEKARA